MAGREEEDRLERYRHLAMQLALRGFDSQQSLNGLDVQDIPELNITAWDRATSARACLHAEALGEAQRQHQATVHSGQLVSSTGTITVDAS